MAIQIKTAAEIIDKQIFDNTVTLIKLEAEKKFFKYFPGQFLHLTTEEYDPSQPWPESRVFSIANSPNNKGIIELLISAKGNFTTNIVKNLKTNDIVWIKLPYGDFKISDNGGPIFFVAGGTGISPFISYLDFILNQNTSHPIYLIYGVRHPGLIIYEDKITGYIKDIGNFKTDIYIENSEMKSNGTILEYSTGRIDLQPYYNIMQKEQAKVYLSGPLQMINFFKEELIQQNIPTQNIFIDNWN